MPTTASDLDEDGGCGPPSGPNGQQATFPVLLQLPIAAAREALLLASSAVGNSRAKQRQNGIRVLVRPLWRFVRLVQIRPASGAMIGYPVVDRADPSDGARLVRELTGIPIAATRTGEPSRYPHHNHCTEQQDQLYPSAASPIAHRELDEAGNQDRAYDPGPHPPSSLTSQARSNRVGHGKRSGPLSRKQRADDQRKSRHDAQQSSAGHEYKEHRL